MLAKKCLYQESWLTALVNTDDCRMLNSPVESYNHLGLIFFFKLPLNSILFYTLLSTMRKNVYNRKSSVLNRPTWAQDNGGGWGKGLMLGGRISSMA